MNIKRFGYFSTFVIAGLLFMFLLINACKNEGVPADQMQKIPFADAQRVYTDYCVKCHSGGENGLDFSNPNGILNSVTPGNSSTSSSYQAMIQTFQRMPPDNVVPTNRRTIVRLWIDQGANP